jgi:translation initiation factor IF-2
MSIRVHDLAKRCGISNKEMIDKLHAMNYPVKSHSSTVDKITAEAIEKEYGYTPPPPPAPEPPPPPPAPVAPPPVTQPVAGSTAAVLSAPVAAPSQPPRSPAAVAVTTAPPKIPPPPAPVAPPVEPTVRIVSKPTVTVVAPPPPRPAVVTVPTKAPSPAAPAEPAFIVDEKGNKIIRMKPPVIVRDLAQRIGKKPHLLLMELMELNVFANLNETIGEDVARKICERNGFVFELERRTPGGGQVHAPKPPTVSAAAGGESPQDLQPRAPVVTFMGHVAHGKTSLLDAIRKTNVAAGEAGGITQHIGASVVTTPDGKRITFLDTPGHEAFTKMRARGANLTDIVVLVVAADDGLMPQTLEAISHTKAAKITPIVAINKCDLPAANPDRVRKQLQEQGLTPESWGGDVITCEVSATTKKGIDHLLEMILLQAEIMELKANPRAPAWGHVIEAQIEAGMGPTATVLVQKGTLRVGDAIICGPHWAKVRALINDKGERIKEAGPSTPAKVVGLSGVPEAGAEFSVMRNEKEARALSEQRQLEARTRSPDRAPRATLEDLLGGAPTGEVKTLNLVIKADVQGSLEAIREALSKLPADKVKLDIIHGAVGSITENDVLLASASRAIIVGFRVKLESGVSDVAKREGVQIKLYTIIYELLEQVEEAMEGLLSPEARETIIGQAEVRQIFELSKGPKVAGCVVTSGRLQRNARFRLLRRRAVQYEGKLASLRHFQDDVKEVKAGSECGLRFDNFDAYQPGDIIECYSIEKVAAKL